MWIVFRVIALILALCPILYLNKQEEVNEKQKKYCLIISTVGVILFIVSIIMRVS